MPAVRSRTENWRRSLEQLHERGGSLELALPSAIKRNADGLAIAHDTNERDLARQPASSIVWRVRLLSIDEGSLLVERPEALGTQFPIQDGIELVGIISIGQNRWMFNTKSLGFQPFASSRVRTQEALKIQAPTSVERCQRRSFYRVSAINLDLPSVEVYPLADPQSAVAAETTSRKLILDRLDRGIVASIGDNNEAALLPTVDGKMEASLHNLGGGGVGLIFDSEHASSLRDNATYWLRIHLNHFIPAPLAVTARLRHQRIDSQSRTHAGFAFDFSCNPSHQEFIINQLCRYTSLVQRDLSAEQSCDTENE